MSVLALKPDDLPTIKVEEWKYTNLPSAVPEGLKPASEVQEIIIHKTRGHICEQAEDILFTGVDGELQSPVLKIILEEGVELTLIERHEGSGAYWKNKTTQIELKANAKLKHIRFSEDAPEAVLTDIVQISLDRDAKYEGFSLNLGGKMTRHDIRAQLNEPNAEIHLNGVNLLNGKQHGDTTIAIEHKAPHCSSNQFYRSLLDKAARGVFQGKVHVHKAAQKTDAYQLSNALLLSPRAEMDTKPELEIYADDVKCSHGATTGQLDEEPLFYLRSRGLSEKDARFLLVEAFVNEVIEKIVDKGASAMVYAKTTKWIKSALSGK